MPQKARIKLMSISLKDLEGVCQDIVTTAKKSGAKISGPIPLPTKKIRVTTMRSPNGEGTKTWDHWELRIHRRIIDISSDERTLRRIMRIKVPDNVRILIELG